MNTKTIFMKQRFGEFLSNGSLANALCSSEVLPSIEDNNTIVIDMEGVENMTDSFGNALFANAVILLGDKFLKNVRFINCSPTMKTLITISVKFGKIIRARQVEVPA